MNEEKILQEIRKLFQTEEKRSTLLKIMIEEIRYQEMLKEQKEISYIFAADKLVLEAKNLRDQVYRIEKMKFMKRFNF
jgi:hypothetical protein